MNEYKPLRSTAPLTSILNAERRYVPSAETDLRALFARLRAESAVEEANEDAKKVSAFKWKAP